ncbi:MAG: formylglycine-generating enzyme family protein [Synechococcaceae cyanobacterium]|jgi:formylglycine-generating enzyme required for sulfatase activity
MTSTASRTATFLLRQPRQVQGFREKIRSGDQVSVEGVFDQGIFAKEYKITILTMVWIPPGRFWMGSPPSESERREREGPQHLVQLQGFFMGQTPITQAQWREVAGWQPRPAERWGRELDPEPMYFQSSPNPEARGYSAGRFSLLSGEASSDLRPVENVSWEDAMEFCNRLSQRTGRYYTLPSEAQWEYACRAGTNTPFSFGATLTSQLANYDGDFTYASGPKGDYRRQTTPVGMFPANAWGLQDMHGTIWEWCLDHWHENYEGAPTDGSAWLKAAEQSNNASAKPGNDNSMDERRRLLRGGSWYDDPRDCRSAYRNLARLADVTYDVGFRVVCLPQDPSLNP